MSAKASGNQRTSYRAHVGDNLSKCAITTILVAFYGLFILSIIIGVVGPKATQLVINERPYLFCISGAACTSQYTVTMKEMGPYNQFILSTLAPERPLLINEQPAMLSSQVSYTLTYELDIQGVTKNGIIETVVNNATHTADISCAAGSATCSSFNLFYLAQVAYPTYIISTRFINPVAAFAAMGANLQGGLTVIWQTYTVPAAYSSFQLGWRYFFFTIQLILWLIFTVLLCRGRKDANGNKVSSSPEQKLVWWLSFFAIFFNDPAAASIVLDQSFGTSILNGIFTVTFVTFLLFYLALHFHLTALQGEYALGLSLSQSASAAASRRANLGVPMSPHLSTAVGGMNHPALGLCFWAPKLVLATAMWIVGLSAFLFLRYKQLSDPAFSLWEVLPSDYGTYVMAFLYGIVTIYLLYIVVFAVLACRHFKRLRPSAKVFLFTTLTTLLVVIIGVYLDVFSPLRTTSASYLVVYATANLYVALLIFLYLPDRKGPSLGEVVDIESGAAGGEDFGPVSTTGVMALGGDDDDDGVDAEAVAHVANVEVAGVTKKPTLAAPGGSRRAAANSKPNTAAIVTDAEGEAVSSSGDANRGVFVVEEDEDAAADEGSDSVVRRP